MYRNQKYSGLNPPVPPSSSQSTTQTEGVRSDNNNGGRRLLTLVRLLEKKTNHDDDNNDVEDDGYSSELQEAIEILHKAIASCQRFGILEGNQDVAEKLLLLSSSVNSSSGGGGSSNSTSSRPSKKARRSGNKSALSSRSELSLYDGLIDDGGQDSNQQKQQGTTTSSSLDINYLMSALLRILLVGGGGGGGGGPSTAAIATEDQDEQISTWMENRRLLVILASDLITAIGEYILQQQQQQQSNYHRSNKCARAEYELIAMSGKQLLTGLQKTIGEYLAQIGKVDDSGLYRICSDDDDHDDHVNVAALVSCFRASTMLVCLFGTRLSRSTAILSGLRDVGWDAFGVLDEQVVYSAAVLLSALPLAGGKDASTASSSTTSSSSDVWNTAVKDAVASINTSLRTITPINSALISSSSSTSSEDDGIATDSVRNFIQIWMGNIRTANSEELRVDLFLQLLHGLTVYTCALLDGPWPSALSSTPFFGAEINVTAFLDLIETMLSFPVAAEAVYLATKKRLRGELIDNGYLSSRSVVNVANVVKLLGLDIFDSLLECIGGPSLLPFSQRIKRISCACALASSSTSLRKTLDPSSMIKVDGKRRRWLHTSIRARTSAIKTLEKCILLFGIDKVNKSSSSSEMASTIKEMERSVSMVGGSVIELLVECNGGSSFDWGSSTERTELVTATSKCLTACLVSGGEFLSEPLRALIDSVANVCLLTLIEDNPISRTSSNVRISFLSLGTACLTTPWPDGAASSISGTLLAASRQCELDPDADVALAAASARRVCDMSSTPRVPALRVVTRSALPNGSNTHLLSIDALIDKLADSRRIVLQSSAAQRISKGEKKPSKETAKKKQSQDKVAGSSIPDTENKAAPLSEKPSNLDVEKALAATQEEEDKYLEDNINKTTNEHQQLSSSVVQTGTAATDSKPAPDGSSKEAEEDDNDDEEFPMIVDCGPDQEDADSD